METTVIALVVAVVAAVIGTIRLKVNVVLLCENI